MPDNIVFNAVLAHISFSEIFIIFSPHTFLQYALFAILTNNM